MIGVLFPLIFFQIYLTATIILYMYGPWPFINAQSNNVLLYLFSCQFSIAMGYIFGIAVFNNNKFTLNNFDYDSNVMMKFLNVSLIINLIFFIPTSLARTGNFYPNIVMGILNPGLVYLENSHRLGSSNNFVFVEYLRFIVSPWTMGLFPITVIMWRSLSIPYRLACVFFILWDLSIYVATGRNKGMADYIVTFPWFVYIYYILNYKKFQFKIVHILILIFFVAVLLSFFGMTMIGRGIHVPSAFETATGIIYSNKNDDLINKLPTFVYVIYSSLARYLAQGYYALSLAFTLDHPSTLGFGSSIFLSRNADRIFGGDFFETQSIPGLLELHYGWYKDRLWHSIYPWLASDFGYIGTLVVLAVLGFILSLLWQRTLVCPAPFEIVLLFQLFILFYYIPANNQVFQFGESLFCFNICLSIIISKTYIFLKLSKLKSI